MKLTPQIFLSYAREDREHAEHLYQRLKDAGFKPWLDRLDIFPGESWLEATKDAIHNSEFMIILLSHNAVKKQGHLQTEIRTAIDQLVGHELGKIILISVRLEECQRPTLLSGFHTFDLFERTGWDELLWALTSLSKSETLLNTQIGGLVESIETIGQDKPKSHLFVAMPFTPEMEDIFFYGIQRAIDTAGYDWRRMDKDSFTGDVLQQMKSWIETSAGVIADLSGANPNVYLEVGYGWGKEIPTILLIREGHELKFDVSGQRCLHYTSIRSLEDLLTAELKKLKAKGLI